MFHVKPPSFKSQKSHKIEKSDKSEKITRVNKSEKSHKSEKSYAVKVPEGVRVFTDRKEARRWLYADGVNISDTCILAVHREKVEVHNRRHWKSCLGRHSPSQHLTYQSTTARRKVLPSFARSIRQIYTAFGTTTASLPTSSTSKSGAL